MSDVSDPPPVTKRLQELLGSISSVIAPITLISALLFYFGYVYTTTEYAYFGLDVDTIGLSTQEFIMRSPPPLLSPLLLAGLTAIAVTLFHGVIRRRIDAATDAPWRLRKFRRLTLGCHLVGQTIMVTGGVMVLAYAYLVPRMPLYALVTPMVLGLGAAVTAYGVKLDGVLGRKRSSGANAALYAVLTVSLFWTTATLAQYFGQAQAITLGQQLAYERPNVLLDTKETLYTTTPTIHEQILPPGTDQAFHFRYSNLCLLIQGKDRLFLVPSPWRPGDPTLVVPIDDVRVQFRTA